LVNREARFRQLRSQLGMRPANHAVSYTEKFFFTTKKDSMRSPAHVRNTRFRWLSPGVRSALLVIPSFLIIQVGGGALTFLVQAVSCHNKHVQGESQNAVDTAADSILYELAL